MDKFKVPSTLHIDQAKRLVELIEEKAEGGNQALSAILEELKRFSDGETGFNPEAISPYASKEEIEKGWSTLAAEIDALYAHVQAVVDDVTSTRRANEEMSGKMQQQLAVIKNLYTDAKAIVDAKDRIRTSSEFFLSDQNIDYDRIAGTPLQIRGGSVSLPYASEPIVLNGEVRATIIPGTYIDGYGVLGTESNGFPGNNHEVRKNAAQELSEGAGMNGLSFVGAADRMADVSAILDNNEQTHFEYERITMRPTEQELIAKGNGLQYEVTDGKMLPYLGEEDEALRLSLLLTLENPSWINEIDLRPYVPTNYGAKAPRVKDILVGQEYEPPVSVLKKEPQANEWVFRFKPVFATTIIVKLEQETAYPTDLGHIRYEIVKEIEGQTLTIDNADGLLSPKSPIVVDGPAISISDMGFKVDDGKEGLRVAYSTQSLQETTAKSMSDTVRQLQNSINPKERKLSLQRIEGARKVIGLRDVLVKEAVYLDKGELVTKPIHFDEPLDRITLEADATPERSDTGVEIRYHVSIDDGVEWHEIQPMNSELGEAPKLYRIVQDDADVDSAFPVIRSNRDVYEIRFKMTMERVGISAQSGPKQVPDTPELFMYKMTAETRSEARASRVPSILPPKRLKGNVIGGAGPVEDTGGQGPSFEELAIPEVDMTVEKENCHNVPMSVHVSFTHDKPVVEAIIYLDGKEVYREEPGVEQKQITIDIPTSYFAERSRVSVSATITDGIKDARVLKSVLVVPCQDAGGRDIDISASYPEVGQTWTVSGFARSSTDIDNVTLYINDLEYPVSQLPLAWKDKERVEFIKVFSPEEVEALGFEVGQAIELKWIAKDIESQEWDDILVLQYVDRRPPEIPCGQVTYLGVSYYDWNIGGFATKEIDVPNWDTEDRVFEDGRGIKTIIEWNELMAAPVLMVRNGIGDTGGVLIGKIELRYKKLLGDGTLSPTESITFMEGAISSSKTDAIDLAYGEQDLTTMELEIHRTGRFTGNPRLMELNAYLVPDFGEEYRSNVCGTGITDQLFEPEENKLLASEVEVTGASCESNKMFLIEYYDKTIGRRVLHGQKRDGSAPQETIYLPDSEGHDVVLKWSDTMTGVAVIIKSDNTDQLVVTAIGVLVESNKIESRYGISYIESEGYNPVDESFAIRNPSQPLEVSDLYAEGQDVPELSGVDSKLFLGTKAREMFACAVDPDDPAIKQDEYAPTIASSTTLLPSNGDDYCLDDASGGFPVTFTMTDDMTISDYEIYHNGEILAEEHGLAKQSVTKNEKVDVDWLKYIGGGEPQFGKADIVFSVDTSGSMGPYITKVQQKMDEFKQYLIDNNVDAYIGAMDSRNPHSYLVPLAPAATVDLSGLATNSGGWEANNWTQVTGADELFANTRIGAKKVIILVTDTYIGTTGVPAPPDIVSYVEDNSIQVSALALEANRTQYESLTSISGGSVLDMSGDPDMSILAEQIGVATGTGESFTVIVTDTSGKMATKTFKYDFLDCLGAQTRKMDTLSIQPEAGSALDDPQYKDIIPYSLVDASSGFPFKFTVRSADPILSTLVYMSDIYFNDSSVQSAGSTYLTATKATQNSETMLQDVIVNIPIRKSTNPSRSGQAIGVPRKKANILLVIDRKARNSATLAALTGMETSIKNKLSYVKNNGVQISEYSTATFRKYYSPLYDPGFDFKVSTLTIGDELTFSPLVDFQNLNLSGIAEDANAKWEEVGMTDLFKQSGGIIDWAAANAPTGAGLDGGFTKVVFIGTNFISKDDEHVASGLSELEYKKSLYAELYDLGIVVEDWAANDVETSERITKYQVGTDSIYASIHTYEADKVSNPDRSDEYLVHSKTYMTTASSLGNVFGGENTEGYLRRLIPYVMKIIPGGKQTFQMTGDLQGLTYTSVGMGGKWYTVKTADDRLIPYLRYKEEDRP